MAKAPRSPRKALPPAAQADPAACFTAAEVAAANATRARAGVRTPAEVLEAFSPTHLQIGELTLRLFTMADAMLLERIGSPFAEESITPDTEITAADTMAVVFILTRPATDTKHLLDQGRAAFDDAVLALAARVPFEQISLVGPALARTFSTAFSTLVAGQKKATTTAPSVPPPATASAGSSPSSTPSSPSTAGA
jgi:hypothetical protein